MSSPTPHLEDDAIRQLREALTAAAYTVDGVLELLGAQAYAALARDETVPALRATNGRSPRETLTRLFILQAPVDFQAAKAALPLDDAIAGGLVEPDASDVRALVDIRPYAADDADWWVVSDLGTGIGGVSGPVLPDHVLGVGGASTTLAGITVRPELDSALDLGTGCGVQALHLSRHVAKVTASDRSSRALAFADLTARLSGVELELVEGSLFEPVARRQFDQIVSNPPFVVSPGHRFTYRDSGLPGDEVCRRIVGQAPDHLNDGGWCQLLANWLHVAGNDWRDRIAEWVVPTGCDAWVVQRDVQDPAEYAELWLRDSGDHRSEEYTRLYDTWLDEFAANGVEGVGFGWITLHKAGHTQPYVRIEEIRQPVDQPLGRHVHDWFRRHDWLRDVSDDDLLAAYLTADPAVSLDQHAVIGPAAWEVSSSRLRLDAGLHPTGEVDPVGTAVVAACDGSRPLADVLAGVASAYELDPADLHDGAVAAVRGLVEEGFLRPAR